MAAVSVQRSPHVIHNMASRRTPLANIPNAGNSPFHGGSASTKRARSQASILQGAENSIVQPPPPKRQAVETDSTAPVTPRKTRGNPNGNPVTPAQRQHAPRTREVIRAQRQEHLGDSMEKLRQWQKHNEKAFPTYVFFFENVPEAARRECSRGIRALGSREATFFSKDVTHIITTRAIPVESDSNPSTDATTASNSPNQQGKAPTRTIDPAVLEKDRSMDSLAAMQRSKFTFEAPRRAIAPGVEVESRNAQPSDILIRAKNMGMKIWGLDKLKRILDVMFEDTFPGNPSVARGKLSNNTAKASHSRPQDLQQLISNEQLHGPADRDAKGVFNELITFKGPYVYVRCCFERVKPIMVREWPKVANRENGDWPQFRSVSSGKCPFVEEDPRSRKAPSKAERDTSAQGIKERVQPKRAKNSPEKTQMQPPSIAGRKRPLAEVDGVTKSNQQLPPRCEDDESAPPTAVHGSLGHGRPGITCREPMASGIQASNITSAIRSQAISSTAGAPGAKAGTSREIHGLQRKVLGRAQSATGPGLVRSNGMTNLTAAADREEAGPSTRAATQRAQSRLAQVLENPTDTENEPETERIDGKHKPAAGAVPARRAIGREKREMKPGFCENCREKFEDFEEHTMSKRHRKFASTADNWAELDMFLQLVGRPQLRTR